MPNCACTQPSGFAIQGGFMNTEKYEIADVIRIFGKEYIEKHKPNNYTIKVLNALFNCRTPALGGHLYKCDHCGKEHGGYNSCRNRNCPKCQSMKQTFWVEDRMNQALPVKHYHIVFTVPGELNQICLLDSKKFYSNLFKIVWETLQTFGYSHFGAECGAICVLHSWGQNLSLHPHIHCIVPAAGLSLKGNLKPIGKKGKYLFPVRMLSTVFRAKLLQRIKKQLSFQKQWSDYKHIIEPLWKKPWVVYCEPSLGSPQHIVKYLGQYTHRVAISNKRILKIEDGKVTFSLKDYKDNGKRKTLTINGVEFLRRFCMHILPSRFVKIRYYGIYSNGYKKILNKGVNKLIIKIKETNPERFLRLTGIDVYLCPFCKKGKMVEISLLPRIRAPGMFIKVQTIIN